MIKEDKEMNNNIRRDGETGDRYLRPLDVWGIAFGCIVGWGAFVMPGTIFLPLAGPAGTIIAMAISMVIMLVIGRNYTFLMTHRPGSGGSLFLHKGSFRKGSCLPLLLVPEPFIPDGSLP